MILLEARFETEEEGFFKSMLLPPVWFWLISLQN